MTTETQILQYAKMRYDLSRADDAGEVSATTLVLAGLLVLAAAGVGGVLITRLTAKANSINLDG